MRKCYVDIKFNNMKEIYDFMDEVKKFQSDVDLTSTVNHRYIVDGKSILGVLSLDASSILRVRIISNDESEIKEFLKVMRKYECIEKE